jgi:hypothetical protein
LFRETSALDDDNGGVGDRLMHLFLRNFTAEEALLTTSESGPERIRATREDRTHSREVAYFLAFQEEGFVDAICLDVALLTAIVAGNMSSIRGRGAGRCHSCGSRLRQTGAVPRQPPRLSRSTALSIPAWFAPPRTRGRRREHLFLQMRTGIFMAS